MIGRRVGRQKIKPRKTMLSKLQNTSHASEPRKVYLPATKCSTIWHRVTLNMYRQGHVESNGNVYARGA
jgi:hypothetical protein